MMLAENGNDCNPSLAKLGRGPYRDGALVDKAVLDLCLSTGCITS